MKKTLPLVRIQVNPQLCLKDPESSSLGKSIVRHAIDLIYEMGFEAFTFRKLGQHIESPEASIYRYFESKQRLLMYLTSWYWTWLDWQLHLHITNIESPSKRLQLAIALISNPLENPKTNPHVDFDLFKLNHLVWAESSKAYLHKDVDKANKEGAYLAYKQFVNHLASIVLELQPTYKYPHMLISTVIEGMHYQVFFAEHLPSLTNKQRKASYLRDFYYDLILRATQP